ncbi:hypothetical protein IID23_02395, partial [Patescibacteria group bacterium]|nr:hypothetical protein [Patescibacteria group bacterium]
GPAGRADGTVVTPGNGLPPYLTFRQVGGEEKGRRVPIFELRQLADDRANYDRPATPTMPHSEEDVLTAQWLAMPQNMYDQLSSRQKVEWRRVFREINREEAFLEELQRKGAENVASELDTDVSQPVDLHTEHMNDEIPSTPPSVVEGGGPPPVEPDSSREELGPPPVGPASEESSKAPEIPQRPGYINDEMNDELKGLGYPDSAIAGMSNSDQALIRAGKRRNPVESGAEDVKDRNAEEGGAQIRAERTSEVTRQGSERTVSKLSPEEEQALRDRLQRRTQEGFEDPYVKGAEMGKKYKKLDNKAKEEFSHIVSLYVVQKEADDEKLDINNPLIRSIDRYGDFKKEDNFRTSQDTLNVLSALRMMREENVPHDVDRDLKNLEGKLINNLQVNSKQGLGKLFSRWMPNSRAVFAEEHWLGEDVDAEELLIKGLNAETEHITHEAEDRDERPSEPEQTTGRQEVIEMMSKLMDDQEIDPTRLEVEALSTQYLEQAEKVGVPGDQLDQIRKEVEAYGEETNSEKAKSLLWLLFVLSMSMAEMTRRG